jgi:hypothetical protein
VVKLAMSSPARPGDAKFLEDVGQMRFHGAPCHVQLLGDLRIAETADRELGDPVLGGGQRPGTPGGRAPRTGSGCLQLVSRPLGRPQHSVPVREVERLGQRLTRGSSSGGSSSGGGGSGGRPARILMTCGWT